jgi:hypothetical protein
MTEESGFDSLQGKDMFLFSITSRTALELNQIPIQWVSRTLSLGVKRQEREADNSRKMELYFHSHIRLHGIVFN